MYNSMTINPRDNVAVAIEDIAASEAVKMSNRDDSLCALENIPIYHKIALQKIKKGESVLKYGEQIGIALTDIAAGSHVHVHNIDSAKKIKKEL